MLNNQRSSTSPLPQMSYKPGSPQIAWIAVILLMCIGLFIGIAYLVGGIPISSFLLIILFFMGGSVFVLGAVILAGFSVWHLQREKAVTSAYQLTRLMAWGTLIVALTVFVGVVLPHDIALIDLARTTLPVKNQLQTYCGQSLLTLQADMQALQSSMPVSSSGSSSFKPTQASMQQVNSELVQLAQQSSEVQSLQTTNTDLQPLLADCQSVYQDITQSGTNRLSPHLTPRLMMQLMNERTAMQTDEQTFITKLNALLFPFRLTGSDWMSN